MAPQLERYRQLATMHASLDGGSDVRRANRIATEMRQIASSLDPTDVTLVNEFAMLLDDRQARGWVAHHLIELLNIAGTHQAKALAVIEERANAVDLDSVRERFWLDKWRSGSAI